MANRVQTCALAITRCYRPILLGAVMIAATPLLSRPAAAQFTCGKSGTYTGRTITVPDDGASASNPFDLACGTNASASGGSQSLFASTAVGANATASASGSTAVGGADFSSLATIASGVASTAIGVSAQASGLDSTAVGRNGRATGSSSTALGAHALASGDLSLAVAGRAGGLDANAGTTAIGVGAQAGNDGAGQINATAVGFNAAANAANAAAFGSGAAASGATSLALGYASNAGGANANAGAIAIGQHAQAGIGEAGRTNASAIGVNAKALAANASAFGSSAVASGVGSAAYGRGSNATGIAALAMGMNAEATQNSAVAIGHNSVADAANVISVGAAGNERRIVNVRQAVNPTDAVNLQQVQTLIAAGAAMRVAAAHPAKRTAGKGGGTVSAPRGQRFASLGESDAVPAPVERSARRGAPVASLSCEFGGGKVTTAVGEQASASSDFALIQQSGISFQQGGVAPGCVTVSFSAEAQAPGASTMEVRAVLNGSIEASPGPVLFAQDIEAFNTRGFNFLFANVAPGAHRIEIHFRNAGEAGWVRIGQRTTMLQFAR